MTVDIIDVQTELAKKRQNQNERKAKSRAKLEKFDMKEVRFEASKSERDQLNDLCTATTGEPFSKQEMILKLIREAHAKIQIP